MLDLEVAELSRKVVDGLDRGGLGGDDEERDASGVHLMKCAPCRLTAAHLQPAPGLLRLVDVRERLVEIEREDAAPRVVAKHTRGPKVSERRCTRQYTHLASQCT